jgi:hypothetical protein
VTTIRQPIATTAPARGTAPAPGTAEARAALLGLHRALLADARIAHEREHGTLTNAAFLQLAAHDPGLAWLGMLSGLIVRLDTAAGPAGVTEVLGQAASLLRCEGGGEFAARYQAAIQASPEVAVAGARARAAVAGR